MLIINFRPAQKMRNKNINIFYSNHFVWIVERKIGYPRHTSMDYCQNSYSCKPVLAWILLYYECCMRQTCAFCSHLHYKCFLKVSSRYVNKALIYLTFHFLPFFCASFWTLLFWYILPEYFWSIIIKMSCSAILYGDRLGSTCGVGFCKILYILLYILNEM